MGTAEPGTWPITFRAMFVEELRARREQMGLLQREFAEKAHVSLSSVKQYEAGKKKPGRKFATWCDGFYGCPGTFERLYDGMIAESYPSWFGPRVLFEDKETCIHEWEMRGIPGLLQTRAYASAVIRACRPYDTDDELDRDAAARIERQSILMRDDPPKVWVVLGEGVLRPRAGCAAEFAGCFQRVRPSWLPVAGGSLPGSIWRRGGLTVQEIQVRVTGSPRRMLPPVSTEA